MADMFVQQTRAQAAMQLSQPAQAFTGGIGGAQPGVMSYATGRMGAFAGGFGASLQQSAGAAMGGIAALPAATAAFASPGARQFGDIIEGARYQGGGAPGMSLTGMLATAYAPTGIFPHAGMAFGMERSTRREMAREELGRRWTQGVRGAVHGTLHQATLGLSSYMMRRTGVEARWMTEMETERTLQNRLGFLRGGDYAAAEGYGVRRDFFTEGPGRGAMQVLQRRAGDLQAQYGYGVEQMNALTRTAAGAVDVTRIQNYAAGGRGGMTAMGREISDIRDTAAAMAREMQMSEKEIQEFFGRLKNVMQVTGEGVKTFQQENRKLSMQGPFSQRQVAEMRMQFTQMGRSMYMGGMAFGTEAMEQANRVAELRRSGVISAETLLREGGGLDPQAMARMIASRLQQQAGLVQGGNFNQALLLAGQNPGAYAGMMGGAGYMETQAAIGATIARNPFALLQAQLDPNAVRRVTVQAPAIAFQRAQQMGELFISQNEEQRRAQMIRQFGIQMGYNVRTPQGLAQARTRYEEMEVQREELSVQLSDVFNGGEAGRTRSEEDIRKMSNELTGLMLETGESAETLAYTMYTIQNDTDLSRRWSSADAAGRSRITREVLATEKAGVLAAELESASGTIGKALARSPKEGVRKARNLARQLEKEGVANDVINQAIFGEVSEFRLREGKGLGLGETRLRMGKDPFIRISGRAGDVRKFERQRLVHLGGGKMEMQTEQMSMTVHDLNNFIRENGITNEEDLQSAILNLSGWHDRRSENLSEDIDQQIRENWQAQLSRTGERFTVESIRQAGMARDEWARARRQGAGVFDVLRRAGLEVSEDYSKGVGQLLDLDVQDKKKFKALQSDSRLQYVTQAIQALSGEGVETEEQFVSMTKIIGQQNMRAFFKEYASSEEGMKRLGGRSFQEFLGNAPMERMRELFQGMRDSEKQALMARTLTSAIEKSQRLINETKRGDTDTMPLYVQVTNKAETAGVAKWLGF